LQPQSKPYDRLLKSLADDDPRSLLHLLGIVPNSEESAVETLPRAVSPPLLEVDHLYAVGVGIKKRLVHLEFQTHYRRDLPDRLTRYVLSLHLQYGLPVQCVLVLLVARHAPVEIPDDHEMQFGGLSVRLEYQVVRLWEISGREALDMNEARILPLIPLFRVSTADLVEAARRIVKSPDEARAVEFLTFSGLRYDKNQFNFLLEAARMRILTEEMLKESSFYQMILEEGIEKGMEKATSGLRNAIREVVSSRFPGPVDLAALDQIKDIDRLQQILTVTLRAQNLAEITAQI
jgi:predicted transposase YdaD